MDENKPDDVRIIKGARTGNYLETTGSILTGNIKTEIDKEVK